MVPMGHQKITELLQALLDYIESCTTKALKKGQYPYIYDYDPNEPRPSRLLNRS